MPSGCTPTFAISPDGAEGSVANAQEAVSRTRPGRGRGGRSDLILHRVTATIGQSRWRLPKRNAFGDGLTDGAAVGTRGHAARCKCWRLPGCIVQGRRSLGTHARPHTGCSGRGSAHRGRRRLRFQGEGERDPGRLSVIWRHSLQGSFKVPWTIFFSAMTHMCGIASFFKNCDSAGIVTRLRSAAQKCSSNVQSPSRKIGHSTYEALPQGISDDRRP